MKKLTLFLLCVLVSVIIKAQGPISSSIFGASDVTSGQTVTYTSNIPSGDFIYWNVGNGTLSGNLSSGVTNSNSMAITWNTIDCNTTATGNINIYKFTTWYPTAGPTYMASLSVTIHGNPCQPPPPSTGPSCQNYANAIESIWNNPSIPADVKCFIIKSIYNSAIGSGLQDTSCLNFHGCF